MFPPISVTVCGADFRSVIFAGFFLGGETLRRSLHDIISPQRKKPFIAQFISTVKSKQPLYMRVCIKIGSSVVFTSVAFDLCESSNKRSTYFNGYIEPHFDNI